MSSVKRNIIWQGLYQIVLIALPLITSPYLSRILGAELLGVYSYSYSIAYYFGLFTMLGVNNYGNKSIAVVSNDKDKVSNVFWSIYLLQFIAGIISVIIYIFTQFNSPNYIISRIQILLLISSVFDINWLFFGLQKFKFTTIRSISIKISTLFLILLLVNDKNDLWKYTLIISGGTLLNQIILWLSVKNIIKKPSFDMELIKNNIKPMFILFIPVVSVSIFKYMDKIMLGQLCNMEQLGFYENSEKIISIPLGLITAIGTVMLPKMSYVAVKQDKKAFDMYMKMSICLSSILASAIMFGLMAVSSDFSVCFWGVDFKACSNIMVVLAVSIVFTAWSNLIRAQYLIPFGKEKIFINATIIGAIVNFFINLLLIPQYGAIGTAIGTVVAELILAVYQTVKIRGDLPIKNYLKDNYIFLILGIIMFISVRLVSLINIALILKLVLEILVGVAIYSIEMIAYFKFNKKIKEYFLWSEK